jgi:hypothetical protein
VGGFSGGDIESLWREWTADGQDALLNLKAIYPRMSADERYAVEQTLLAWTARENTDLKAAALAMIYEFDLVDALPALERDTTYLNASDDEADPDRIKLTRTVASLKEARISPTGESLTRSRFKELWRRADKEARQLRQPMELLLDMKAYYRSLSDQDRAVADTVLIDWVLLGDIGQRFDALALIRDFEITAALPVLRAARRGLDRANGPSVPFDITKVEGVITHLESKAQGLSG